MKARLFNRLWLWSEAGAYRRFCAGLRHSAREQDRLLAACLARNAGTAYGRRYGFGRMEGYRDFADGVPVVDRFADLQPYIERMAQGEADVLFRGKTLFFETTSGSTAGPKWIPYNARLKAEFQTAVGVWMNALYRRCPRAFAGPSYWSLSPALKAREQTAAGIAVGIDSDTDYFNPLTAYVLRQLFALPPGLGRIRDAHAFYVATWRALLARPDLAFVSVWSPNFLLRLDAFLRAHADEVLDTPQLGPRRRAELSDLLRAGANWRQLFPRLALLSCWTQAQAAIWLPELRAILGDTPIEGKGLLATEGVTTLPWRDGRHVLAYTSHFYEFREPGTGSIFRAHDLTPGHVYELLLTTGGGLYRYACGDQLRCDDYIGDTPCLTFMGRGPAVSDLVGEKVSEAAVNDLFARLKAEARLAALYLYPCRLRRQAGYRLLVEGAPPAQLPLLAGAVEAALLRNPYYRQAVDIGQLLPLTAEALPAGFSVRIFEHYCQTQQIRDGDAKLPLLLPPGFLHPLLGY